MPTAKPKVDTKEKSENQGPPPDPSMALSAAIAMFDEEFEKLNIHGKIATISGYIGRIPKNGWNKFNSYAYVLESDLVEYVRYWLAAARILIYVEQIREHTVHTFEGVTSSQGRQRDVLTDNLLVYRVVDGRTGESFTFEVNSQGADPRDKGANKASTSAMKFAYIRLFNISSGEDEAERDEHGDQQQAQQAGPGDGAVTVSAGKTPAGEVQRGGKQTNASGDQIKAISNLSNQLNLGAEGLVGVIKRVLEDTVELPEDPEQHGPTLSKYLRSKKGEDAGKLIYALDEMVKASSQQNDEPGAGY